MKKISYSKFGQKIQENIKQNGNIGDDHGDDGDDGDDDDGDDDDDDDGNVYAKDEACIRRVSNAPHDSRPTVTQGG